MPGGIMGVLGIIVAVVAIVLLFKLLKTPLKWIWKLLINAGIGYLALILINFAGKTFGIDVSLDVTAINAIVIGILGLPGLILLLLIKYL